MLHRQLHSPRRCHQSKWIQFQPGTTLQDEALYQEKRSGGDHFKIAGTILRSDD